MTFPILWGGPQIQRAPSIIENRQSLATPINQHFVEWFSGDVLDSIWTEVDTIGSGTFAMVDADNGGFNVISDGTSNASSMIQFNDINHYDATALIINYVLSTSKVTSGNGSAGFLNSGLCAPNHQVSAGTQSSIDSSNFSMRSSDGTRTGVTLGVTHDTNFHHYKIELTSAIIKVWFDGDLKVAKTTNRPTNDLQPLVHAQNIGVTTGMTTAIGYLEALNT